MMRTKSFLWALALPLFVSYSCDDDDDAVPPPVNEEELITTVNLSFANGAEVRTATWQDLDGPGGNAPVISGVNLDTSIVYTLTLSFLNEQENPAEDITEEVREEDEEHQVFFSVSSGLPLEVNYRDQDGNGNPLGVLNEAITLGTGNGDLQVTLRHEPDKDAAGVSDGVIDNAGGETDVEVSIPITIGN